MSAEHLFRHAAKATAVLPVQSAAEKAHTVKKAGEGKKKASPKKKVQAAAVFTSNMPPLCMMAFMQCI